MSQVVNVPYFGNKSTGWKDVHMKIQSTGEEIKFPIMSATKVLDMKMLLGQLLGLGEQEIFRIEFYAKVGPSYKRLKTNEEIRSRVTVKGIQTFQKPKCIYEHPYCVIGAGHFGLRQAMHYQRNHVDYVVVDRYPRVGGNAWYNLANDSSCTQSEGTHYQLQWDPVDGNVDGLEKDYGFWPSREKIISSFEKHLLNYNVTPNIRLNIDIIEMDKMDNPDFTKTCYDLLWNSTNDDEDNPEGIIKGGCVCHYPGAMVYPRQGEWPAQDVFEGQFEYAHGNLFNYKAVKDQNVIIIGFGAFANENLRTCVEHYVNKVHLVVRHLNVFLPRQVCWFVNQSTNAPPGAMVIGMMENAYKLLGWDVFTLPTVIANKDRSTVLLKQSARWGTGDIFFVAMYFGKAEVIVGEIKRFKPRGAVLTDGTVLTDIDHCLKCLGFHGDFSVDRLHKTKKMVGFYPDGDFRRTVYCEFLAIDAGRFGGTAFAPGGTSVSFQQLWYTQHPRDAMMLLGSGQMPSNVAVPDQNKPAYEWPPRAGSLVGIIMGGVVPEIQDFEGNYNTPFKKASLWYIQPPEVYVPDCARDWNAYCQIIKDQGGPGSDKPWPEYPYTIEEVQYYVKLEEALAGAPDQNQDGEQSNEIGSGQKNEILAGSNESWMPAMQVMRARSRSLTPVPGSKEVDAWLKEARQTVSALRRIQT